MEGLIAAFAELLIMPFILGIAALCELIASVAGISLHLVAAAATEKPTKRKFKIPPVVVKWIQRIALGSLAFFVTALLAINFLFLEKAVRFALDRVEAKTGFEIEYDSMQGNLFTGDFSLTGLDLKQTRSDKPQLSLQAQDAAASLSVWDFIFGSRVVDSASVSNASIHLQTLPKPKEEKTTFSISMAWNEKGLDAIDFSESPLFKTPSYVIENLSLENIDIHVDDRSADTPTSYEVKIDTFQAIPLRSHFAIFDLLFRSNLDGTLNGSRLRISNTEEDGLRHTQWSTSDIPVTTLSSLIGGPFTLFESGSVDVQVTDQWGPTLTSDLQLDWKIKVTDAQARLPASTPKLLQPLAKIWVDNINDHQEAWEFGFQLQLNEDQFYGASSLNAQQIWKDSIPAFIKQVAEKTGIEESTVKEKTTQALDTLKDFFRKPKKKE